MSEVLQANIFFFVTGIAVIVFTLLLCIALYQLIKILKSVRRVIERIEHASDAIADDVTELKKYLSERSPLANFIGIVFGRREQRESRPSQKTKAPTPPPRTKTELSIKNED